MGKTHTFGFTAAARVSTCLNVEMAALADVSKPLAESAAAALGFAKSIDDWRTLVADPDIDIIDIAANALHKEMALAAIAAGKHVYCEKPLAPLASDAREMAEAAEAVKVKTQVGFDYLQSHAGIRTRHDRGPRSRGDPDLSRRSCRGLHGGRRDALHVPARSGGRRRACRHREPCAGDGRVPAWPDCAGDGRLRDDDPRAAGRERRTPRRRSRRRRTRIRAL